MECLSEDNHICGYSQNRAVIKLRLTAYKSFGNMSLFSPKLEANSEKCSCHLRPTIWNSIWMFFAIWLSSCNAIRRRRWWQHFTGKRENPFQRPPASSKAMNDKELLRALPSLPLETLPLETDSTANCHFRTFPSNTEACQLRKQSLYTEMSGAVAKWLF